MNPDDISPIELGVMLSQLEPSCTLFVAARLGLEVAVMRADADMDELLARLRDDYAGGRYHRNNPLQEYTQLQRHRWPPTGNRDLWVKYGPAGPPIPEAGTEAA